LNITAVKRSGVTVSNNTWSKTL